MYSLHQQREWTATPGWCRCTHEWPPCVLRMQSRQEPDSRHHDGLSPMQQRNLAEGVALVRTVRLIVMVKEYTTSGMSGESCCQSSTSGCAADAPIPQTARRPYVPGCRWPAAGALEHSARHKNLRQPACRGGKADTQLPCGLSLRYLGRLQHAQFLQEIAFQDLVPCGGPSSCAEFMHDIKVGNGHLCRKLAMKYLVLWI